MADISTLGIKIDSSQIEKTIKSLDKLAESAAKVESATSKIAATMGAYVNSTKTASSEESKRQKAIDKMIEGLKQQEIRYSSGKTALVDYKLSLLNATEAERKQAKALSEKIQLMQDANKKSIDASDIMGKLATKVSALAAAYFGISAIKNFANEILETAKIADNFKYSLLAVSDSSEQAAETYKYLEKEANRLGQSITGNVDAFTGFMAAAKAANMTTEQAKKAYTGLNEAMTALHRTPEQASQALYALQQMLSTGTVRAQELNIQLGNAIPGAVPMFAQALGKTTSELRDMMQKGLVPANESVIQFTDYLSNKFAPSAEAASDSVQGNLNKMSNAAYNLKKAIVDAMGDNTTGIIKDATNALIDFTNALKTEEGKQFIADLSTTIKEAASGALRLASALGSVLQYANLRSLSGTMEQAAELSKKGMLDIQKFATSSALERQRMVDDVLKKESELQKSQQETIKNQKELLSLITDTGKETKNAGDAFNRGWSPIVGTTAEITDKMRENEKTIKSITEKLQEQAITAGKTGVEKVRAELEAANATDEEKKSILALAAANEQKENARKNAEKAQRKAEQDAEAAIRKAEAAEKARQGSIDKIIDKLRQQIATYNEGKEVLAEYQLKQLGATDAEINMAKNLGKTIDDLKNKKELQEEYNKVIEQTTEKTNELSRANAIAIITKAMQDGLITFDQYKKDLEQVNTFFDKLDMKESDKTINKLTDALEDLTKVDGRSFGNELADGINNAMVSMMDFTKTIENNEKAQKKLEALQKEISSGKGSPEEREQALKDMAVYEENMTKNSLKSYRQLFGTISQLYGENTKEREALHKIEMAFAAAEIAMNLQKTISAAYTAIMGQGGGDPYTAFARIAAMTALAGGIVSAAGGSLSGGGSGGGAASAASSTSSSTVLGSTEGSQSISNSLDFMTDIQSKQYNELKDINTGVESLNKNITGLVTSIVRTGGVSSVSGAVAGTSGGTSYAQDSLVRYSSIIGIATSISSDLMKNVPIIGNLLGNIAGFVDDAVSGISNAIFGGSKKISVLAQGLEVSTGTISDLLDGMGADIQKFADIKVKKEGGLFGSDKTYYKTLYEALGDDNVTKMFTNVFKNMGETMVAISKGLNLGEDNLKQVLEYSFDIGKIDLKGLDADEINKAVSEAISTAGDTAVQALFGELISQYQQIGEGLLETAIRVVSEKAVVDDILAMTNQAFDNAAIPEIALATTQSIIDLAGGIKQLQESSATYFNEFFSDAEKQARLYNQLSGAMASINLPMAKNRDAFRAMVESLDLSTESGRNQYVTMLNLSEAADKYYDALESGEKTTKDNSDAIISMVADTQKAIDQMDMSEFDKSIQNIKDNTEKSIKQLTNMGASESDLAVIREYGNKQIKELTDAHNQQIADEKIASASLRASKQLELDILNGVATEQDKVNFQRQQELKTLPESVQAIQQAIWAKEDEIAANEKAAKIASEKSALELRIDELTMSSSDFLAKKRQVELAAMDDTLKPLQERIYQLEDEASANAKAAEIADKRQSLEIELLNLTGKSAEAVAIQRKIELASLDDSLKPLQERVWALQDEQAATGNVNENITKKYELELRLLELTGKTAEATAIKRERELVGLDATNRDLQKRIWSLEDESEAIQKATDIANERKNLEVQLLELEGKSKEAVALQRQIELASIDDSNKALQERVWQLQDEKEASDAAKAAADQLADREKQYQEQVLSERIGLENELLQLMGNTTELRKRELESLDESNRELQERIWNLQDIGEISNLFKTVQDEISSAQDSLQEQINKYTLSSEELRDIERENLKNGSKILYDKLKQLNDEKDLLQKQFDNTQSQIELIESKKKALVEEQQRLRDEYHISDSSYYYDFSTQFSEEMAEIYNEMQVLSEESVGLQEAADNFETALFYLNNRITTVSDGIASASNDATLALQEHLWALQDEAEAAAKAAQILKAKESLEIQLMEAQGKTLEALAKRREIELSSMDDSLKSIQLEIWAIEDKKRAEEESLKNREKETSIIKENNNDFQERNFLLQNESLELDRLKEVSEEKSKLELRIAELTMSASEYLALTREKELLSIDESNRSLQERIWQLEDEAEKTAKNKAIAEEKSNLEMKIAELTLSSTEYLAFTREKELLNIDDSNKALQLRIWALEDEAEAAAKANEISNKKSELELKIAELTLSSIEYTTLIRTKELEAMDESLRPLQERIWAIQDEAAEAEKAKSIAEEKSNLELKLAELTLSSSEYLALTRKKELLSIDESNRSLQERIWRLEDEAKEIEKLKAIQTEKESLDLKIAELTLSSTEYLALVREKELLAIDESNRSLQERIWKLEDEAAEAEKAKAITEEKAGLEMKLAELTLSSSEYLILTRQKELLAIDESNRAIQEAIWAKEDEISAIEKVNAYNEKKQSMEIQLLEEEGKTSEALTLKRSLELAAMEESLRPIQERIWALQDEKEQAAKTAEEISKLKDINDKKTALEIEILNLTGKAAESLAIQRSIELESLDDSLKPLQLRIWALEDEAAETEKVNAINEKKKELELNIAEKTLSASEYLALVRAEELSQLDASLIPLQERLWVLEDEAAAMEKAKEIADQAKEINDERFNLEIDLLNIMDKKSEALALQRQKELLSIDESNKALQLHIWQLEDEKIASEEAANALRDQIAKEKEFNDKKKALTISLLNAEGKTLEAVAMQRSIELESLEESLKPIQLRIWALEDESAANIEATKIEEDRLEKIKAINDEKANLEMRFAELTLSESEYIALSRQKEILLIDESNRAIQNAIWAKEDEIKANELLAEQAEKIATLAKERQNLEIELLREQGFETEAIAIQRQIELAAMDESLRGIQERIWALQDEKTAVEKLEKAEEDRINTLKDQLSKAEDVLKDSVNKQIEYYQELADKASEALEKATNDLEKAYNAEQEKIVAKYENMISSLNSSLEEAQESASVLEDTFKSLSDARKSMEESTSGMSYKEAQRQLLIALESARKGDISGVKQIVPNLGLLTSPDQEMYKSQEDYKRDFFKTYFALSELETLTGGQLSEQEQIVKNLEFQIETANKNHESNIKALEAQRNAVLGLDTSVKTFEQAIIDYQKAQYEADGANDLLKQQTEQLNNQLNALLNINNSVLSVEEAIRQYQAIAAQIPSTSVSIPGYANGGMAEGTYMVGERGAEILTTPPARITSNSDIKSMLNDEDVKRILAEIKEEISRGNFNIAKNTQETAKTLKKFDYDGMPETRV